MAHGTSTCRRFCGLIFFVAVLLCIRSRRRFILRRARSEIPTRTGHAVGILFTILLTQMAGSVYTALPTVVIAATLIGVSAEMSLLAFLQTVLACTMLGNQMLSMNNDTAPVALSMTHPTYPELGWLTVMLAMVFLCCALIPSRNWRRPVEVV